MEQQEDDTWTMQPFWEAERHRGHRRLRRSYSLLLTSTSLLVLFVVIVLVFSLIVVPTLHSFTSNIFKPRSVKNSWDSLNLILVLFAIVCGFLSRNNNANNDNLTPRSQYRDRRTFSNPSTPPPQWYHYNYSLNSQRSFNRLRSFNSYPDLRQQISADERFRFYDDTYILRNMRPETEEEKEMVIQNVDHAPPSPPSQTATLGVRRNVQRAFREETVEKHEIEDLDAKISPPPSPTPVVTRPRIIRRNVERTNLVEAEEKHETNDLDAKISPPAAATTRPKSVRRNVKRTYQAEGIEKREKNGMDLQNSQPPPSPPSPPPMTARTRGVRRNANRTYQAETFEESETNDLDLQNSQSAPAATRTKGVRQNARPERNDFVVKSSPPSPPPPPPLPVEVKTVEGKKKRGIATKEFLTSFKGKKKKQRQRSVENFDAILNSKPLVPEPPPPPPPPPQKVFQNLFSLKKGKHKKSHIVSVAAAATTTTSMSNKREHYSSYRVEDNVKMTGNESPLIPIPPPPPPPPFKLPAWKFRVQGDFVRVDSISSSRSGSPDLDDVSVDTPTSQCNSPFAKGGEEGASVSAPSLFCPSPDVDTKAHNFIENFRAGLRMAKMNSMRERQGIGRSNLGPSQNHEWI